MSFTPVEKTRPAQVAPDGSDHLRDTVENKSPNNNGREKTRIISVIETPQ